MTRKSPLTTTNAWAHSLVTAVTAHGLPLVHPQLHLTKICMLLGELKLRKEIDVCSFCLTLGAKASSVNWDSYILRG